ncbi:MAG: GTP cyclohydrolase I type 2 [Rhodanobacteraceae bacterium]|jgi:GTP cyclohydrolase I|nr:MAG: GTP cyclohydrolase I type 2 [Rhodanobacteraceae bacterium]
MASADAPTAPDATSSARDELRDLLHPKPDVAAETLPPAGDAIDWVGMQGIEMPILFDAGDGDPQRCRARVDAFVNLVRADRRGIHMSRLYLLLNRHLGSAAVDATTLESLLRAFLHSHHDLADCARIGIHFEYLVRRKALRSEHHGWRAYPVSIEAVLTGDAFHMELGTQVVYSSTCPASLALSRQVAQQRFATDFRAGEPLNHAAVLAWLGSARGMAATPHAQRSIARVRVRFVPGATMDLLALIDRVEHSLGTAVQTAVKREDEQAFAQANAENPMFCEDAARRIRRALDNDEGIAAFHLRVEHQESLHAHDAVAQVSRNFPGSGHGFF